MLVHAGLLAEPRRRSDGDDVRRRAMTNTPMLALRVSSGHTSRVLRIKLEQTNPTGSVKYRTAIGLVAALDADEALRPGTRVVESTSGNLGIALARVLGDLGCHLIAVVDPKVPEGARDLLAGSGASVVEVTEPDARGGYLLTRLEKVRELLDDDPDLRWTNQYSNRANPEVHRATLAREIVAQTAGAVDAVLVAVSTGGTLAGISEALRVSSPAARIYAVDVKGSIVTSDVAHPHLLTGVGATRRSSFLRPGHYDGALRVADVEAIACCRMLALDTGLALGGSSGAIVAAFTAALGSRLAHARCPVAVMPDGGDRYLATIYDDRWLGARGALEDVASATRAARREGVGFQLVYDDA